MISTQEEIELLKAIRETNERLHRVLGADAGLVYKTKGVNAEIKWLNITVWDSEDDDRNYEDNDEYESWKDYLRRTMNNWVNKFNKLKI